jgi:hypothetical protein
MIPARGLPAPVFDLLLAVHGPSTPPVDPEWIHRFGIESTGDRTLCSTFFENTPWNISTR